MIKTTVIFVFFILTITAGFAQGPCDAKFIKTTENISALIDKDVVLDFKSLRKDSIELRINDSLMTFIIHSGLYIDGCLYNDMYLESFIEDNKSIRISESTIKKFINDTLIVDLHIGTYKFTNTKWVKENERRIEKKVSINDINMIIIRKKLYRKIKNQL